MSVVLKLFSVRPIYWSSEYFATQPIEVPHFVQNCMIPTLRYFSLRRVARASITCNVCFIDIYGSKVALTKTLSNEVSLSLLLTQLRKSDVLCKVTKMTSLKKMAKGFSAT